MALYKVPNVSFTPQPKDGLCWWASAQMCYLWGKSSGKGSMISPNADPGFKNRYDNNLDWFCGDNGFLAKTLTMKTHTSIPMDCAGLTDFLKVHGPVFTSVNRTWKPGTKSFFHAVVISGAADTGVWVNDPWPVGQGESSWITWSQIKKATDACSGTAVRRSP